MEKKTELTAEDNLNEVSDDGAGKSTFLSFFLL